MRICDIKTSNQAWWFDRDERTVQSATWSFLRFLSHHPNFSLIRIPLFIDMVDSKLLLWLKVTFKRAHVATSVFAYQLSSFVILTPLMVIADVEDSLALTTSLLPRLLWFVDVLDRGHFFLDQILWTWASDLVLLKHWNFILMHLHSFESFTLPGMISINLNSTSVVRVKYHFFSTTFSISAGAFIFLPLIALLFFELLKIDNYPRLLFSVISFIHFGPIYLGLDDLLVWLSRKSDIFANFFSWLFNWFWMTPSTLLELLTDSVIRFR